MKTIMMTVLTVVAFGRPIIGQTSTGGARCFELRTYTVAPGKLDALHRRFENHATGLFRKHHIDVIAFWMPADRPGTLMYMLAHPTCDAAPSAWKAFFEDPEWISARDASEKEGPLVTKVEKVFMTPTPYSPLK